MRKGEKATLVVFWKFANSSVEEQDGEEQRGSGSRLLFTRGYSVFNAAQVEGYLAKPDADTAIEERIASAEDFFRRVVRWEHDGTMTVIGRYERRMRSGASHVPFGGTRRGRSVMIW